MTISLTHIFNMGWMELSNVIHHVVYQVIENKTELMTFLRRTRRRPELMKKCHSFEKALYEHNIKQQQQNEVFLRSSRGYLLLAGSTALACQCEGSQGTKGKTLFANLAGATPRTNSIKEAFFPTVSSTLLLLQMFQGTWCTVV
jgi:hypothetical protein